MSISIKTAISTIFSKNTNKINLVNFILLFILFSIFIIIGSMVLFANMIKQNNYFYPAIITVLVFSLINSAYYFGFQAKSINNSIKCKKHIFENPLNIISILKIGIKALAGTIFAALILITLPLIIGIIIAKLLIDNNVILGIIAFIPFILLVAYNSICICPTLMLRFYNSFDINVFIQFKEAKQKFQENRKIIIDYIKAAIMTWILATIILIPIFILIWAMFHPTKETMQLISSGINGICNIIIWVIWMELSGQAGRLLFFEENKKEIAKA